MAYTITAGQLIALLSPLNPSTPICVKTDGIWFVKNVAVQYGIGEQPDTPAESPTLFAILEARR